MSEFKLTGDFYVSEWNGDSLNDGSAATPFSHPNDVTGGNIVVIIGAGYYKGAQNVAMKKRADGIVVFDFDGLNSTGDGNYAKSFSDPSMQGIRVIKCNSFQGNLHNGGGLSGWHVDCFYEINEWKNFYRNGDNFVRCILKSYTTGAIIKPTTGYVGNTNSNYFYNCIFLDDLSMAGDRSTATIYQYCYLPSGLKINLSPNNSFTALPFLNSMLNGIITFNGVEYECKKLFDGSPRPDANPLIADLIDLVPTVYTNGAFSGDPKFIDIDNKIVQPDSDLLKKSNAYGYIGGVKPGKSIKKGDTDTDLTITTSQIDTSNPSNWTIGAGYDEGYIFITFKLSDNIVQVPKIHMDALLALDSSEVGGTSGNNNVPDFFPTLYTPLSQAGLKPNRLTYGLRTSQQVSKPTSESQWDNDSTALGSDVARYYVQEWSDQPKIYDVLGVTYGGGNPESVGVAGNTINARWCQVQIRLTNRREQ